MAHETRATSPVEDRAGRSPRTSNGEPRTPRSSRLDSLTAGGPAGNERLTVLTGIVLIVLLAVLGVTIVRIGQLLWLHLFLGLLLLGPVALKLLSTGYRFVRYYTASPPYRRRGPPAPVLRGLAPLVVLFTVVVFATGVALLFVGRSRGTLLLLHKVSFFVWLAITALHVLGHLSEMQTLFVARRGSRSELNALRSAAESAASREREQLPGRSGRLLSLGAALMAGLVLAAALIPQFGAWTH
jgi:hypothetical protein